MIGLTHNQFIKLFSDIAISHREINSFGSGDLFEYMANEADTVTPITLWAHAISNPLINKEDNPKYTLLVMDVVDKGQENLDDVRSDTLRIAKDIMAILRQPYYEQFFKLENNTSFDPFVEKFDSEMAGWQFDISFKQPFIYDSCSVNINGLPVVNTGNIFINTTTVRWGLIQGTLTDQADLIAALNLKVPISRTLTINGTSYDLSSDRTWNISTNTENLAQVLTLGNTTGSNDIIMSQETAATILSLDVNKKIKSLSLITYPSLTELSYGKGVTSAIQIQLNAKQATITTGSSAQYFRGDLSLATFPTAVSSFSNDAGYLTGITSLQVTTALGFTPYNATNPSGYITASALSPYLTISSAASTYEPIITASISTKYWRGDKTFQTLDTLAVTENTNLYFTNARAIASTLTGYTSGAGTISSTDSILSAIQKLNGNIGALTTGVSSVFGRTGAVIAVSGDYTTTLVTEGTRLYFTTGRVDTQVATYTGDITLSGTAFTIGANKVVNSMINSVAWSKVTSTPTTLSGYGITDAQPLDSDLTTIAGLTATTDNFIVSVASAWASRTPSQVRTTLGLVIGTNVQAWDTDLDSWAAITRASGFDTFTATPSSANLLSLLTTKTGTALNVFSDSPAFTTLISTPQITGTGASNIGLTLVNTVTASSAVAYGVSNSPTLSAAANGDELVGLYLNPTFTLNSKTSTNSIGISMLCGTGTARIGNLTGTTNQMAIYMNIATPNSTNFTLSSNASQNTTLSGATNIALNLNGSNRFNINTTVSKFVTNSVVCSGAALTTSATDGFLYIPTCAGTPSGVPSTQTGTVAMVFDTTNGKLYIYNGSWKGGTTPGIFI